MIKTLRITSVIAAILAVFFIVVLAVFGARRDERVDKLLKSPGAVEKFKQAKGATSTQDKGQTSPLIQQAKAFALYLNPPPKPKPKVPTRPQPSIPRPTAAVSAKFELKGTAYYASRPELSIALIDEPGKGSHWVGQSSKVGHLVIEQVKDGLVVVQDGQRTFELVVNKPPERSLTKAATSGEDAESLLRNLLEAGTGIIEAAERQAPPTGRQTSDKAPPTSAEDQTALMGKMIGELEAMQAGIESDQAEAGGDAQKDTAFMEDIIKELKDAQAMFESGKTGSDANKEDTAAMKKFVSDLESMRISAEEAKKLDDLGKELNGDAVSDQEDPNLAQKDVVDTNDANSQEPNSSAEK